MIWCLPTAKLIVPVPVSRFFSRDVTELWLIFTSWLFSALSMKSSDTRSSTFLSSPVDSCEEYGHGILAIYVMNAGSLT